MQDDFTLYKHMYTAHTKAVNVQMGLQLSGLKGWQLNEDFVVKQVYGKASKQSDCWDIQARVRVTTASFGWKTAFF